MKHALITLLSAGLLTAALGTQTAQAEDHKALATQQALAAANSGKQGNAAGVGEHAAAAKTHAETAQAEKANPHLSAGIKNLNEAIDLAKQGKAADAGEAADAAATHLEAAERSF